MDLKSELEKANEALDDQLAKSNCVVRWIARRFVQSKYQDNIKKGITHGTDFLHEVLQKL